ncbi:MAG: DUF4421 domain-containing protein [Bacteroidales bacterium]|jgi:hypothetical protein|nr:DUF4421 domain-containing protein [Bacteroidales bacterium]
MKKIKILTIILLFANSCPLFSQDFSDALFEPDCANSLSNASEYIENHSDELLLRLYNIYKYNGFHFSIKGVEKPVRFSFSSAPQLNLGFGFNYKWLGLNFGFNFGFINPHLEKYGKESRLDGQFHLYPKKFVIDGIFQYYKGFYIRRSNVELPNIDGNYATMPELRLLNAGVNFLYSFNNREFSYQAAFVNNEIQKKSAGTVLLGGNILWEHLQSDPENMAEYYPNLYNDSVNFSKMYFLNFGIIGGYAYTFVLKDFYISAAATPGINMEINNVSGDDRDPYTGALFKFTVRIAAGYNKGRFFTSMIYFIDGNVGAHNYGDIFYRTGNMRFSVGMRLNVHKKKSL